MEMFENNTQGDNQSFGGGESGKEPFAVGTNMTIQIALPSDGSASSIVEQLTNSSQPFIVGTNTTIQLGSENGEQLREQLSSNNNVGTNISTWGNSNASSGDANYSWGSNGSFSGSGNPFAGGGEMGSGGNPFASGDSLTGGGEMGGGNPFAGGGEMGGGGNPFASVGNAPKNDDNYQWNFNRGGEGGSDLDALFQQSPWGSLSEVGITSFSQIFPNASADSASNPFASGSSSSGSSGNPFAAGSGSFGGGSGNPFGGSNSLGGESTANVDTNTNYTWDL